MAQLFISDLHLSPARPAIVGLFESFLLGPAHGCEALYILGDLFEYWAGDDDLADAFNAHIAQCLANCSNQGARLFFMHGNRDFLIGGEFARTAKLTLLDDSAKVELAHGRVSLSHGDLLCTDDLEYQAFRAKVRSPAWQQKFLSRPLGERKTEIEALRVRSEAEKQVKSAVIMDVNEVSICNFFRRENALRMIHGHTHRPARHIHDVDGIPRERWVLSDWYDNGSYLLADGNGIQPMPWSGH